MVSGNDTGMNETHISFYLRSFRIHLFVDALRGIGSPRFIQFLVGPSGTSLAMVSADKKGFRTHRVPKGIYEGQNQMEINSMGAMQADRQPARLEYELLISYPWCCIHDSKGRCV